MGGGNVSAGCRSVARHSAFELRANPRQYAGRKALREAGGIFLRPWMLTYDAELGMKGVLEPVPPSEDFKTLPNTEDVLQMICQLILSSTSRAQGLSCIDEAHCGADESQSFVLTRAFPERLRFATDPNLAGTEKLAVAAIEPSFLALGRARPALQATDIVGDEGVGKDMLGPMSVFNVKGWTRSVCAITVLLHGFEDQDAVKAGQTYILMVRYLVDLALLAFRHKPK